SASDHNSNVPTGTASSPSVARIEGSRSESCGSVSSVPAFHELIGRLDPLDRSPVHDGVYHPIWMCSTDVMVPVARADPVPVPVRAGTVSGNKRRKWTNLDPVQATAQFQED